LTWLDFTIKIIVDWTQAKLHTIIYTSEAQTNKKNKTVLFFEISEQKKKKDKNKKYTKKCLESRLHNT